MTAKSDFTDEQWDVVLEGPTSAGMIVITAQRGETLRETISMAKAYAEARQQHGQSELLDAIVAAKPEIDHKQATRPKSSSRPRSRTCATPSRCFRPRRHRRSSTNTSASSSASRTGSRARTASTVVAGTP